MQSKQQGLPRQASANQTSSNLRKKGMQAPTMTTKNLSGENFGFFGASVAERSNSKIGRPAQVQNNEVVTPKPRNVSTAKYGSGAFGLSNQAPRTVQHTTSKLPPTSQSSKYNRDKPDRTKLGETVPTLHQLKQKYNHKLNLMSDDHEKLIE